MNNIRFSIFKIRFKILWLICLLLPVTSLSAQERLNLDCNAKHQEDVTNNDYNNYEHGDWVMIFQDEFDGNAIDLSKWYTVCDGWTPFHGSCGSEMQYYSSNNIFIDNGILKLEARKEEIPMQRPNCDTLYTYSSGWIQTKNKFRYGLFEARCRVPRGEGFWPAFWLFGHLTEIDIFEFYGHERNTIFTDMHKWSSSGSRHCPQSKMISNIYDNFHVYRIEWDEFKIEYSVDDVPIRTKYKYSSWPFTTIYNRFDYVNYNRLSAIDIFPDSSQSVILNLALSGNHPPDENTIFPSSLEVDYIRIYKRNNKDKDTSIAEYDADRTNYITGRKVSLSDNSEFIISDNEFLLVSATQEVSLQPGFYANSGSCFQASVGQPVVREDTDNTLMANTSQLLINHWDSIQYNVIDQMQDGILIQVFPNPNNGFFNIVAADDSIVIEDIVIDDYRGNPVFKQSNLYCEKCEVRLTEPGTYYARVHTNKDTVLKKIVVR